MSGPICLSSYIFISYHATESMSRLRPRFTMGLSEPVFIHLTMAEKDCIALRLRTTMVAHVRYSCTIFTARIFIKSLFMLHLLISTLCRIPSRQALGHVNTALAPFLPIMALDHYLLVPGMSPQGYDFLFSSLRAYLQPRHYIVCVSSVSAPRHGNWVRDLGIEGLILSVPVVSRFLSSVDEGKLTRAFFHSIGSKKVYVPRSRPSPRGMGVIVSSFVSQVCSILW